MYVSSGGGGVLDSTATLPLLWKPDKTYPYLSTQPQNIEKNIYKSSYNLPPFSSTLSSVSAQPPGYLIAIASVMYYTPLPPRHPGTLTVTTTPASANIVVNCRGDLRISVSIVETWVVWDQSFGVCYFVLWELGKALLYKFIVPNYSYIPVHTQ